MFIIVKGNLVETGILDKFPKVAHKKGYKYLGILESSYFHTKQAKYIATKEQLSCLQKCLQAQLLAQNIMVMVCAYAVLVIEYMFGFIKWSKWELCCLE